MRSIIMPIAQRLKEVRTYNLYTQKHIADILDIHQSTYAGWENYKRIIPLKHLNTLSNYYNLSLDYLLGLTDKSKPIKKIELSIDISSRNFTAIRNEHNLTTRGLANILKVGYSTISSYENKDYFLSTDRKSVV